ncbi:MAG: hypothetical protein HS111_30970 [Kofleriaceae bacterium]|nr:hypothetical protein [Kofleriaceae bacterium]
MSDHDTSARRCRCAAAGRRPRRDPGGGSSVTTFIHFGTARAEQVHVLAVA